MASGRIIQFNRSRGYGFIEQDNGGEDVFIHSAELGDLSAARLGTRLEFMVMRNERGLKACNVRVLNTGVPQPAPTATHAYAPVPPAPVAPDDDGLVDVVPSGE